MSGFRALKKNGRCGSILHTSFVTLHSAYGARQPSQLRVDFPADVTPLLCDVDSLSETGKRSGAVIDKIGGEVLKKADKWRLLTNVSM